MSGFRPPGMPTNLAGLSGGPPPWIRTLVPSGASLVFYVTTTTDSSATSTITFTSQTSTSRTTFSSATQTAAAASETKPSTSASSPTTSPTNIPAPSTGISPVWIGVAVSLSVIVILLLIIAFLLFRRRRRDKASAASALELGTKEGSKKDLRSELPAGCKTPQQLQGDEFRKYELGLEEKKYELAAEERKRELDSAIVSPLESVAGQPPPYGVNDTVSPLSERKSNFTSPTEGPHELDGRNNWYVQKRGDRSR